MTQLSEHLTLEEVTHSNTATRLGIDNSASKEIIEHLKVLANTIFETIYTFLDGKLVISSGYRCDALNKAVKGAKNSYHTKGMALDIISTNPKIDNKALFEFAKNLPAFSEVIWEYGTKNEPKWVHVAYDPNKLNKEVLTIGVK